MKYAIFLQWTNQLDNMMRGNVNQQRSPRTSVCYFQLCQHVLNIDELVIKDVFGNIKEPENRPVANGVVNVLAFFSSGHHVAAAQLGELLRYRALLNVQALAQIVDSDFPVA